MLYWEIEFIDGKVFDQRMNKGKMIVDPNNPEKLVKKISLINSVTKNRKEVLVPDDALPVFVKVSRGPMGMPAKEISYKIGYNIGGKRTMKVYSSNAQKWLEDEVDNLGKV